MASYIKETSYNPICHTDVDRCVMVTMVTFLRRMSGGDAALSRDSSHVKHGRRFMLVVIYVHIIYRSVRTSATCASATLGLDGAMGGYGDMCPYVT